MHNSRLVIILLLFFLIVEKIASQSTFRISYDIANFDLAGGMVVTPANEYVFAGTNASFIPYYGNIVKLDNTGGVLWAKSYTGGIATTFNDIKNVSTGGFIVCGQSSSGGAILIKVDNNGNVVWANRYLLPDLSGNPSSEFFNAVIETSDGGFLAVGGVDYFWDGSSASTVDTTSFFAVKVNSTGALQWSRVWTIGTGNTDENYFTGCAESANGYLLVGLSSDLSQSPSNGDYPRDAFLVKVDKNTGATIYANRFGSGNTTSQIINSVITLSSGNFLIGGSDDINAFVARLDGTANSALQLFGRRINGSSFPPVQYVVQNLMENADGNYSFIGWRVAGLLPPTLNSAIIKMNSATGAIIFGKSYAPIGLSAILPKGGLDPSDQGYYLINTDQQVSGFNYNVIRTDNNGDIGISATGCTNTAINPSTSNYNITFQSITTNSYAPATSSAFTPLVSNLSYTNSVHCLNCNLSIVPALTATPNPVCAGQTSTIIVTNTVSGYNYNVFTTPTGGSSIGAAPMAVSPSTTTTYYVEVQSQSNLSCVTLTRTPITITVNPTPTLNFTASPNPICAGNTLSLSASGATSYTWNGPSGFTSVSANTTIPNVSPVNSGTYTLTGSASGCSTSSVISVTVSPVPSPTAGANSPLCEGSTLSLTALPNGLTSYFWSGPSSFTSSVQNPTIGNITTTAQSGTYTLSVTNSDGCSSSTTIMVTIYSPPSVSVTTSGTITCSNPTVQIVATTTSTPVSYTWSGSGITTGQNSPNVIVNQGGAYNVIVEDLTTGCYGTASITVNIDTISPTVTINPLTQTLSCSNPTAQISVSGSAVSYTWMGSGIISGANTATVTINNSGTYTVIGSAPNGCTAVATSTVFPDVNAPVISLSSSSETITCSNPSPTISANTGTMTNVSYSWAPASGISSGFNTSTATFTASGNYTLVVTNISNGCSTYTNVTISTNTNAPSVSTSLSSSITCTTPTAQIIAYTTDSPVNYVWNGSGIIGGLGTGTVIVNQGGIYTVTVTNTTNGCSSTSTINVPVNMNLSININGISSLCSGQSTTLSANGASSYTWSTGDNTSNIIVSPTINTTYSVIGVSGVCTGTALINITVNNNPTLIVSPASATIQIMESIQLIAGGANTYTWIPSEYLDDPTSPNPTASPVITTDYCVWGSNLYGCVDSACVRIYVDNKCDELFVPNVFSPNGDGNNDELCVYGTKCIVKDYLFVIYDRWGEKVFQTTDKSACWDGTYKGKPLSNATFVYYIKGKKYDNTSIDMKGNITIVK